MVFTLTCAVARLGYMVTTALYFQVIVIFKVKKVARKEDQKESRPVVYGNTVLLILAIPFPLLLAVQKEVLKIKQESLQLEPL